MKAFVWKRVVIDIEGGTFEVVKNDLKALDPTWKGKQVIWKDIKESDRIDLKKCLEMYPAKVVQTKVTTETAVKVNAKKTFFESSKS